MAPFSKPGKSTDPDRVLMIACGALAHELSAIQELNGLTNIDVECLPAKLHNTPKLITKAVQARIERARPDYDQIFVGYADCGTGGHLDALCKTENVERLAGAHCYEFFAGSPRFQAEHESELGTFYLTDFLVKHFERLVWEGFGIAEHPELRDMYFANYTRVLYLTQRPDPKLDALAERHAERLGLPLQIARTGYGDLESELIELSARSRTRTAS